MLETSPGKVADGVEIFTFNMRMIFLFTLKGYFSINFFPSYYMYIARNKRDQKPFHIPPLFPQILNFRVACRFEIMPGFEIWK